MTGFFIGSSIIGCMFLIIGYTNIKYGNPLVEADRKLIEEGKLPELL